MVRKREPSFNWSITLGELAEIEARGETCPELEAAREWVAPLLRAIAGSGPAVLAPTPLEPQGPPLGLEEKILRIEASKREMDAEALARAMRQTLIEVMAKAPAASVADPRRRPYKRRTPAEWDALVQEVLDKRAAGMLPEAAAHWVARNRNVSYPSLRTHIRRRQRAEKPEKR
jgi:hypothetical protein